MIAESNIWEKVRSQPERGTSKPSTIGTWVLVLSTNKLECLSIETFFRLVYYLGQRQEHTWMEHLSQLGFWSYSNYGTKAGAYPSGAPYRATFFGFGSRLWVQISWSVCNWRAFSQALYFGPRQEHTWVEHLWVQDLARVASNKRGSKGLKETNTLAYMSWT